MVGVIEPNVDRLLSLVRESYDVLIKALPTDRGHCFEIAGLARIIASAMGIEAALCRGYRVLTGDDGQPVHDMHGWLRVGSLVLHSPTPGVVELAPHDPAKFVESWRIGPPPD